MFQIQLISFLTYESLKMQKLKPTGKTCEMLLHKSVHITYVLIYVIIVHMFFLWALILAFLWYFKRQDVSPFSSERALTIKQRSILGVK